MWTGGNEGTERVVRLGLGSGERVGIDDGIIAARIGRDWGVVREGVRLGVNAWIEVGVCVGVSLLGS